MTEPDEKSKIKIRVIGTTVVLLVFLCVLGGFFLLRGTETRETSNKENYVISALICTASSPENVFFSSKLATSVKHTVKVTFKDEKADKISYSYEGELENNEKAESVMSAFHANYNIDMSNNGRDPESLTPSFVASDKTVRINLYSTVDNLNSAVAKFFFLTSEEQGKIATYSRKTVQKIYEKVGFKCEYNN